MQKIIVTGGLGFIGSNLIELLLKKNFIVINIDKVSYSSNFYNTKEFKTNKNYSRPEVSNSIGLYWLCWFHCVALDALVSSVHIDCVGLSASCISCVGLH